MSGIFYFVSGMWLGAMLMAICTALAYLLKKDSEVSPMTDVSKPTEKEIDKALEFADGGCPRGHCEVGTCDECKILHVLADAYRSTLQRLQQAVTAANDSIVHAEKAESLLARSVEVIAKKDEALDLAIGAFEKNNAIDWNELDEARALKAESGSELVREKPEAGERKRCD